MKGIRLSQAAPSVPITQKPVVEKVYGVNPPISSASLPSVYHKKIGNLFRGRLLVLPSSFTIAEALEKMAYYNVTSAPIMSIDPQTQEKMLLGFVDILDILAWVCGTACGQNICEMRSHESTTPFRTSTSSSTTTPPPPSEASPSTQQQQPQQQAPSTTSTTTAPSSIKTSSPLHLNDSQIDDFIGQHKKLFSETTLESIIDLSQRNPFHVLHADTSLLEAVESYLQGVHRIAIIDDNQEVIGVLSQWSIANYLATVPSDDKEWIPTLNCSIKESQFKTSEVMAVAHDEQVINCFLVMFYHNLSSIAVVDKETLRLRGNLSASDLKGFYLFEKDLSSFKKPVLDFLETVRHRQNRPPEFTVSVSENTSMLKVIRLMNKEIVHRVYIVDENNDLTGVISLSDLMKALVVKDIHTSPAFASLLARMQPEQRKQLEKARSVY